MVSWTPLRAIRRCYANSIYAKAALLDGEVACIFGLSGVLLSDIGEPWLLTSPAIERLPTFFVREARRAVSEMLTFKPRLEGWVDAAYEGACDLLTALDFRLGDRVPHRGGYLRQYWMERA